MQNQIKEAFVKCEENNCLEVYKTSEICIYDDNIKKRCCIYKASDGALNYPYFTIYNPDEKEINFLAIDNCILFDEDGKKCDFAAFDEKVFCFVEIKRALGNSSFARSKRREESILQLRATLEIFLSAIDLNKYRIVACSCVGYNAKVPAAPAQDLHLMVDFINSYNTELYQGNEITFT